MTYLKLALFLAALGGAWGVYHAIQKQGQRALELEHAQATIAQLTKARAASDKAAEELKARNREQRRQINDYQSRASKIAFDCGQQPPNPELDQLLYDLSHHGVTDELRRTAQRVIAAARWNAMGKGKGQDTQRATEHVARTDH